MSAPLMPSIVGQVSPILTKVGRTSGWDVANVILDAVEQNMMAQLHSGRPDACAAVACWLMDLADRATPDGHGELAPALFALAAVYARTYLADVASMAVETPDDASALG